MPETPSSGRVSDEMRDDRQADLRPQAFTLFDEEDAESPEDFLSGVGLPVVVGFGLLVIALVIAVLALVISAFATA